MTRKIFISYRRDDAKAEARSLYQHLIGVFGSQTIFMDVDSIQKGLDYTKVLSQTLDDTGVMLVVMGRSWLNQHDPTGRPRLDDPKDPVRVEVASALRRNIPLIPVRVDGAELPGIDELPDDLKELTHRQGTVLTHENFDSDVRGLEDDIRRHVSPARKRNWLPIGLGLGALLLAIGGGVFLMKPSLQSRTPSTAEALVGVKTSAGQVAVVPVNKAADQGDMKLRAAAVWASAKQANTLDGYRDYLRRFPAGDHRREATDAAIPLVIERVKAHVNAEVSRVKTDKGEPSAYLRNGNPRAMAFCIHWQAASVELLPTFGWGASSGPGFTVEEREKMALAFCNNNRREGRVCTCEIGHVNGEPALKVPPEWVARQLR